MNRAKKDSVPLVLFNLQFLKSARIFVLFFVLVDTVIIM